MRPTAWEHRSLDRWHDTKGQRERAHRSREATEEIAAQLRDAEPQSEPLPAWSPLVGIPMPTQVVCHPDDEDRMRAAMAADPIWARVELVINEIVGRGVLILIDQRTNEVYGKPIPGTPGSAIAPSWGERSPNCPARWHLKVDCPADHWDEHWSGHAPAQPVRGTEATS